jgi:hypothetical protein
LDLLLFMVRLLNAFMGFFFLLVMETAGMARRLTYAKFGNSLNSLLLPEIVKLVFFVLFVPFLELNSSPKCLVRGCYQLLLKNAVHSWLTR